CGIAHRRIAFEEIARDFELKLFELFAGKEFRYGLHLRVAEPGSLHAHDTLRQRAVDDVRRHRVEFAARRRWMRGIGGWRFVANGAARGVELASVLCKCRREPQARE